VNTSTGSLGRKSSKGQPSQGKHKEEVKSTTATNAMAGIWKSLIIQT